MHRKTANRIMKRLAAHFHISKPTLLIDECNDDGEGSYVLGHNIITLDKNVLNDDEYIIKYILCHEMAHAIDFQKLMENDIRQGRYEHGFKFYNYCKESLNILGEDTSYINKCINVL